VTVPTSRFEQPLITMNGRKSESVVHVPSGAYTFEVTGKLKPLARVAARENSAFPFTPLPGLAQSGHTVMFSSDSGEAEPRN